jgi:hypothetical protein
MGANGKLCFNMLACRSNSACEGMLHIKIGLRSSVVRRINSDCNLVRYGANIVEPWQWRS